MQETFDHFEFETVHPDAKRDSAGNDSFYTLEKGEEQMSSDDDSSTVGNGARRLSIAVARMSRQLFGDAMDSNKVESERKNVNPYLRARELDKRQSSGVVDIKKPPVSLVALTSPAAFKLSLKRTLSSTKRVRVGLAGVGRRGYTCPPIPAHLSSSPGSTRSSSAGRKQKQQRCSCLFGRATPFDDGLAVEAEDAAAPREPRGWVDDFARSVPQGGSEEWMVLIE